MTNGLFLSLKTKNKFVFPYLEDVITEKIGFHRKGVNLIIQLHIVMVQIIATQILSILIQVLIKF